MRGACRAALTLAVAALAAFALATPALAQTTYTLQEVLTGEAPGVSVLIYGTGYGDTVSVDFSNTTGDWVTVESVPGTVLEPDTPDALLLTSQGDSWLIDADGGADGNDVTSLFVFTAELEEPTEGVFYGFAGYASGDMMLLLDYIDTNAFWYDYNSQEAVWNVAHGWDISDNEYAQELVDSSGASAGAGIGLITQGDVDGSGGDGSEGDGSSGTEGGTTGGDWTRQAPSRGDGAVPPGTAAAAGVAAAVLAGGAAAAGGALAGAGAAAGGGVGGAAGATASVPAAPPATPQGTAYPPDGGAGRGIPPAEPPEPPPEPPLGQAPESPGEPGSSVAPEPPPEPDSDVGADDLYRDPEVFAPLAGIKIDESTYNPFAGESPPDDGVTVNTGPRAGEKRSPIDLDVENRRVDFDTGRVRGSASTRDVYVEVGDRPGGVFAPDQPPPQFDATDGDFSVSNRSGQASISVHGGGATTSFTRGLGDGSTTVSVSNQGGTTSVTEDDGQFIVSREEGDTETRVGVDPDTGDVAISRRTGGRTVAVIRENGEVTVGEHIERGPQGPQGDRVRSISVDDESVRVRINEARVVVNTDDPGAAASWGRPGHRTSVAVNEGGGMIGRQIPISDNASLNAWLRRNTHFTPIEGMQAEIMPEASSGWGVELNVNRWVIGHERTGDEHNTWVGRRLR